MTTKQPRPSVTVIALCYNHERFLIECLESIRAQTFQDFELIVTDDCSRDASAGLIQDWLAQNFPDARFIRHEKNMGLCATLNEALSYSRGEFISMVSTDDVWEPDKIERQVTMMQSQPDRVAVVYSDATRIDETGVRLPTDFIEFHRPGILAPTGKIFASLAEGNFIPAMATLIRRNAVEAVGGYDERLSFEDYDMWLRLAHRYDFAFCRGTFAKYRIVSTSMIQKAQNSVFSKSSLDHHYTLFLICEKWLPLDSQSAALGNRLAEMQYGAAHWLYVHGDPRARACLWKAAIYTFRPRALITALACSLGISQRTLKRLKSFAQNLGRL